MPSPSAAEELVLTLSKRTNRRAAICPRLPPAPVPPISSSPHWRHLAYRRAARTHRVVTFGLAEQRVPAKSAGRHRPCAKYFSLKLSVAWHRCCSSAVEANFPASQHLSAILLLKGGDGGVRVSIRRVLLSICVLSILAYD